MISSSFLPSTKKKKKKFLHPFQAIKTNWSLNSSCCLDYYSIGYPDSLITAGKIYWETQTNWVERLCEKTFLDISLSPLFFSPSLETQGQITGREGNEMWTIGAPVDAQLYQAGERVITHLFSKRRNWNCRFIFFSLAYLTLLALGSPRILPLLYWMDCLEQTWHTFVPRLHQINFQGAKSEGGYYV